MDFSQFDTETLGTIVDSLRDAEENEAEGFYISGDPIAKELSELYGLLADKVEAGMTIVDRDEIRAIGDALIASEENCLDLAILDAAEDYAAARSLVLSA